MAVSTHGAGASLSAALSNTNGAISSYDRLLRIARNKEENDKLFHSLDDEGKLLLMSSDSNLQNIVDDLRKALDDDLDVVRRATEEETSLLNKIATSERLTEGHRHVELRLTADGVTDTANAFVSDIKEQLRRMGGDDTAAEVIRSDKYLPPSDSTIAEYLEGTIGLPDDDGYEMSKINDMFSALIQTVEQSRHFEELSRRRQEDIDRLEMYIKSAETTFNDTAKRSEINRNALQNRIDQLSGDISHLQEVERKLQRANDDIDTLRVKYRDVERQNNDLSSQLAMKESAYQNLQKSSSATTTEVAELKSENRKLKIDLENVTQERAMYEAAYDIQADENKEIREQVEAEWKDQVERLEVKTGEQETQISNLRLDLRMNNEKWSQVMTVVLTANATGEDISAEIVHPILEQSAPLFASLDAFQVGLSTSRRFASGGFIGVDKADVQNVTATELLALSHDIAGHPTFPNDLSLLAWMEDNTFNDIHHRRKTGAFVLLSFKLLVSKTSTRSSVARGLAYIQLANMSNSYRPDFRDEWSGLVHQIIVQHPSLSTDILGQACLVCLAMTTDSVSDHLALISTPSDMTTEPGFIDTSSIDQHTHVADIMKMLSSTAEFFASVDQPGIQLVVFRIGDEETVFANHGSQGWMCSVQALDYEYVENGKTSYDDFQVIWGDKNKGQHVSLRREKGVAKTPFQTYMEWNHDAALRRVRSKAFNKAAQENLAKVKALPDIFAGLSDSEM